MLAVALAATAAAIDSPVNAQALPVRMSPTHIELDKAEAGPAASEIIVTARRREERLQDVPVAITALSARALNRNAVTDLVGIAQLVPRSGIC